MIRKAVINDIKDMQKIINAYAGENKMLSRSLNDLYEHIRDFFVYIGNDNKVLGCCSLHVVWDNLAEVKALAVVEKYTGKGIAHKLIEHCIEDSKKLGVKRLFTLTYIPNFFKRFGFKVSKRDDLPHKVWRECINCPKFPDCDETAMEMQL